MAEFQCDHCGGTVEYEPGDDEAVCPGCQTTQPVPLEDDEPGNKAKKIVAAIALAAVVAILFFVVRNRVILPAKDYKKAAELYNAGKYEEAIEAFEALGPYKDSNSRIRDCQARIMDGVLKEQNDGLKSAAVGATVRFGFYEQDNDTQDGKEEIEWLVLAVDGNHVLLVSRYALDCKPYNSINSDVTWATCSLRKWLNNDFFSAAFGAKQQAMIETVTVTDTETLFADEIESESESESVTEEITPDEPEDESDDEASDEDVSTVYYPNDQVFLLSLEEVQKYFTTDEAKKCAPTDHAIEHGAWASDSSMVGGKATGWWWLRTPGASAYTAALVISDGTILTDGLNVYHSSDCVRPAIWVTVE